MRMHSIHNGGTLFTSEYCPKQDHIHQRGTLFTNEYCPGENIDQLENNAPGDTPKVGLAP